MLAGRLALTFAREWGRRTRITKGKNNRKLEGRGDPESLGLFFVQVIWRKINKLKTKELGQDTGKRSGGPVLYWERREKLLIEKSAQNYPSKKIIGPMLGPR